MCLGFAALTGNLIKQLACNGDDDDGSRCIAQSNKILKNLKNMDYHVVCVCVFF
jgi:hypothetical protein